MKKWIWILGGILIVLAAAVGSFFIVYNVSLGSVSNDSTDVVFSVNSGEATNTIIDKLKSDGLIKNEFFTKLYVKLSGVKGLMAGNYNLNKSMDTKSIIEIISSGKAISDDISVTFVEGKRITYYANVIADAFNYSYNEVMNTFNDKVFLKELIEKYWFISDDILNDKIYYGLEGYIFPDTYSFNKDSSIKDIINVLVKMMGTKLDKYKDIINNSDYSIHELLTLASIVELEGANSDDRAGVAGVFYNRIKSGWTLGSDVTTYYAAKKDFDVELSMDEYNACNAYNTRGTCFKGLPVGPICSVSVDAIEAVMNPEETNYYYFVADKNKKTYFASTDSEFQNIINSLKNQGLWYTY